MHENTWGRVTFLVKLIFCRLDKFDGSVFFLGAYIGGGSYIWVIFGMLIGLYIFLGGVYRGKLIYVGLLMGFYGIWQAQGREMCLIWNGLGITLKNLGQNFESSL